MAHFIQTAGTRPNVSCDSTKGPIREGERQCDRVRPHRTDAAFADASTDQLVQAMAGFAGGGAPEGLNAALPDPSQQPLLTAPQHV
jgi:hypothetical protein